MAKKGNTFSENKEKFDSFKIENWEVVGGITGKISGQASVVEVKEKATGRKGVFRYLKRSEELDVKRFHRELKVLTNTKFKHPNIINILHFPSDVNQHWYISEKGEDFKEYWNKIKHENESNPDKIVDLAVKFLLKLIEGLIALHDEKVVHRDIKPDNIIIVNDEPVLIDFGLVFHPDEERISPVDSPVGNVRFSPDQMMNRMDEVPAWLDVFQLTQVFIWMVSEKPAKDWSRPLDWRWVIYPDKISDSKIMSIRGVTAICSDPFAGPSDARKFKTLLENVFMENPLSGGSTSPEIEKILESVKAGKALSLVTSSADLALFNSSWPLFEKTVLDIIKQADDLQRIFGAALTIEYRNKFNVQAWADRIKSTTKFEGHMTQNIFDLYCGDMKAGHFWITSGITFWVPSQLLAKQGTDYHPEGFLPFGMGIGNASNKELYEKKRKYFYLAMDNSGQLWYSNYAQDFKTSRKQIEINTLLEEISSWVKDEESWKIINS